MNLSNVVALDLIADQLAQTPWTPDTLDQIADIVRATGRTIDDEESTDGQGEQP